MTEILTRAELDVCRASGLDPAELRRLKAKGAHRAESDARVSRHVSERELKDMRLLGRERDIPFLAIARENRATSAAMRKAEAITAAAGESENAPDPTAELELPPDLLAKLTKAAASLDLDVSDLLAQVVAGWLEVAAEQPADALERARLRSVSRDPYVFQRLWSNLRQAVK